jgi:hypothetical protein
VEHPAAEPVEVRVALFVPRDEFAVDLDVRR